MQMKIQENAEVMIPNISIVFEANRQIRSVMSSTNWTMLSSIIVVFLSTSTFHLHAIMQQTSFKFIIAIVLSFLAGRVANIVCIATRNNHIFTNCCVNMDKTVIVVFVLFQHFQCFSFFVNRKRICISQIKKTKTSCLLCPY